MSRLAQTYDEAVETLDAILQAKTTHGVKNLLDIMRELCELPWENQQDQNDFAQTCRNFELWTQETGRTSIGRKQFEEWWEVQGTGETGSWSPEAVAEANGIDLPEDNLPEELGGKEAAVNQLEKHFETVDNSKDAQQLKVENDKLRKRVRELEGMVDRYERERKQMREMLMWGLNN
jgi:hypothetical protein